MRQSNDALVMNMNLQQIKHANQMKSIVFSKGKDLMELSSLSLELRFVAKLSASSKWRLTIDSFLMINQSNKEYFDTAHKNATHSIALPCLAY